MSICAPIPAKRFSISGCSKARRVAPAFVTFLAKREAALFVKIDAAVREVASVLVDHQQHVERQRLDGEGDRLCRQQRSHEGVDSYTMGVKGSENVLPTEWREFEYS
jgi:hypothetical protein